MAVFQPGGRRLGWREQGRIDSAMQGVGGPVATCRIEQEREKLIEELRKALSDVKTLSGLIPICSICKKIRDDKGYWNQIEAYIQKHSDAQFSHGICDDCVSKHYPDVHLKKD